MHRLFSEQYPTRVVVGVDGTAEGLRATAWAALLADRSVDSIDIIHAWIWPLMKVDLDPVPGVANSGLRHAAEMVLQDAVDAAAAAGTQSSVTARLVVGDPAKVLLTAAEGADITVVGNRGLGGFYGRLLGSTGMSLVAHSHGPVLIVRGEDSAQGPIVAGVDGSAESTAALEPAAALARRLEAPLRIVYVLPSAGAHHDAGTKSPEEVLDAARSAALTAVPGIDVSTATVTARSAAKGLLQESVGARMLILGAHGKGRRFERAVGSTANAALQHSGAPILITRAG